MYCSRCLYNLAHLSEPKCPECGHGFDPHDTRSYLKNQRRGLPLLGTTATLALTAWCTRNRALAFVLCLALHLGIRTWGIAIFTMTGLIALIEGESGRGRTRWENVIVIDILILFGFYITHALLPHIRRAGIPDPLRLWSYPIGITIVLLVFASPLRP